MVLGFAPTRDTLGRHELRGRMRGFFNTNDNRARLRVRTSGPSKTMELTFEIDTGASQDLFIQQELADELGVAAIDDNDRATLADGKTKVSVKKAELSVEWMGAARSIEALVWALTHGTTAPARNKNTIDGLIGRGLLADTKLEIDYVNRKVLLSKPVNEGT
jgi:predicted aspartyl protease